MKNLARLAMLLGLLLPARAAQAQQVSSHEGSLLDLINGSRAQVGLPALALDLQVSAVARNHSYDMASNWFFSHHSPTTGDVDARLRNAKVPFGQATQNIAYAASPREAHASLMGSSANREVILSRTYTHVGVGVVQVGRRLMVTENFVAAPGARFGSSPWNRMARPLPAPWGSSARPAPVASAPAPARQPERESRWRHGREQDATPQQCALQGRWEGVAQDGMLRGRTVTFDFWGVGSGTARGSSGSITLDSRWVRQGDEVTLTDVGATPSIAACPASQTGRYSVSFSEDCHSVHIVGSQDSCSHRSMTLRGLQARRVQ